MKLKRRDKRLEHFSIALSRRRSKWISSVKIFSFISLIDVRFWCSLTSFASLLKCSYLHLVSTFVEASATTDQGQRTTNKKSKSWTLDSKLMKTFEVEARKWLQKVENEKKFDLWFFCIRHEPISFHFLIAKTTIVTRNFVLLTNLPKRRKNFLIFSVTDFSVVSFLLRPSLAQNCCAVMFVCASPSFICRDLIMVVTKLTKCIHSIQISLLQISVPLVEENCLRQCGIFACDCLL